MENIKKKNSVLSNLVKTVFIAAMLLLWFVMEIRFCTIIQKAVADPGFPRGGGANPKGGAPTYYLANFS